MATNKNGEIPSVKDLASSEPSIRRRALQTINSYLSQLTTRLSPLSALQLWKGFFYALYMHDSKSAASVHQLVNALAATLTLHPAAHATADTINANNNKNTLVLTEAFWTTMSREWLNIDALRMDKYLSLVRVVVRTMFEQVIAGMLQEVDTQGGEEVLHHPQRSPLPPPPPPPPPQQKESAAAAAQIALLTAYPLSPRERKVPDGLRYHVLDIYIDELEKALLSSSLSDETEREAHNPTQAKKRNAESMQAALMAPVERLAKEGLSKGVRLRAKEVLADQRLGPWRGGEEEQ